MKMVQNSDTESQCAMLRDISCISTMFNISMSMKLDTKPRPNIFGISSWGIPLPLSYTKIQTLGHDI